MTTLRNIGPRPTRTRRIARVGRALGSAALAGGLTTLAACGDSPLAGAAPTSAPRLAATTTVGDTTYTSFRVEPTTNRMLVNIGAHKIDIPQGAVCDVATAGYGPALWDAPCAPSAAGIDFTAKAWTDAGGHPRLVITPDVRFVPGKVVTITLKDPKASLDATSNIAWCPTGGTKCVVESASDPALAPTRDGANGQISRRVKHFSGYNVVFGFDGDGSTSEMAMARPGLAAGASGYITTTGFDGGDGMDQQNR